MNNTDSERLLTVAQAAQRLNIHPNTLRSWGDRGIIPMVKLQSGYRRFRADDVEQARGLQEQGLLRPPDLAQRQPATVASPLQDRLDRLLDDAGFDGATRTLAEQLVLGVTWQIVQTLRGVAGVPASYSSPPSPRPPVMAHAGAHTSPRPR